MAMHAHGKSVLAAYLSSSHSFCWDLQNLSSSEEPCPGHGQLGWGEDGEGWEQRARFISRQTDRQTDRPMDRWNRQHHQRQMLSIDLRGEGQCQDTELGEEAVVAPLAAGHAPGVSLPPLPPSPALLTIHGTTRPCASGGTLSPEEHLVMRTGNSPARNRGAAKPPADGNGVWNQTGATEVKGSGLHYLPLESPCPPEICHSHFKPFHFYGQV